MSIAEQYLRRYAEAEAALAGRVSGRYRAALVVPLFAEDAVALDGWRAALGAAGGRVLLVLVVNAARGASEQALLTNAALLDTLRAPGTAPEMLGSGVFVADHGAFEVLAVDRSSAGHELPPRQGVGLARKIGMDLALALWVAGAIELPWLFGTDADATLPVDYFARAAAQDAAGLAALLYPFRHEASADAALNCATMEYEMALRYHVLGLRWAGSPYAYQSIGSTIAVGAEAYAAVRGTPKRRAGEDFHLLGKLAKVGALRRMAGAPIAVAARRSDRVPFGTGPGVERIERCGSAKVAHPDAFRLLAIALRAIEAVARARDPGVLDATLDDLAAADRERVVGALDGLGARPELARAVEGAGRGDLRRRLHTWFDALRTLQWLHAVRDTGLADLPLVQALERAPFTAAVVDLPPDGMLAELARLDEQGPSDVGPTKIALRAVDSLDSHL